MPAVGKLAGLDARNSLIPEGPNYLIAGLTSHDRSGEAPRPSPLLLARPGAHRDVGAAWNRGAEEQRRQRAASPWNSTRSAKSWPHLDRVTPSPGKGHLGDRLLHRRHRLLAALLRAVRHRDLTARRARARRHGQPQRKAGGPGHPQLLCGPRRCRPALTNSPPDPPPPLQPAAAHVPRIPRPPALSRSGPAFSSPGTDRQAARLPVRPLTPGNATGPDASHVAVTIVGPYGHTYAAFGRTQPPPRNRSVPTARGRTTLHMLHAQGLSRTPQTQKPPTEHAGQQPSDEISSRRDGRKSSANNQPSRPATAPRRRVGPRRPCQLPA